MDLFGKRNRKITVEPFGGDIRPAVIGPYGLIAQHGRLEFILMSVISLCLLLTVVNIGFALLVMNRMDSSAYVADGSRFGCAVPTAEIR